MPYGSVLTDNVQSSTANTPTVFKDGNGTQIGTLCRAWVNFNGQGTVAIRASFNVSSITDNGTGDYTVNFTTALPDANYSVLAANAPTFGARVNFTLNLNSTATPYSEIAPTTTAFRGFIVDGNGSAVDPKYVSISVFR